MINWYNIIGAILLVLAIVTVFVTDMLDLGILAFIAGSVLIQVRIEKKQRRKPNNGFFFFLRGLYISYNERRVSIMKRKMLYIFMVIIILLCGVSLVDGEVEKTEPDEIIYEAEEPVYVEYYENGIFTNSQD